MCEAIFSEKFLALEETTLYSSLSCLVLNKPRVQSLAQMNWTLLTYNGWPTSLLTNHLHQKRHLTSQPVFPDESVDLSCMNFMNYSPLLNSVFQNCHLEHSVYGRTTYKIHFKCWLLWQPLPYSTSPSSDIIRTIFSM